MILVRIAFMCLILLALPYGAGALVLSGIKSSEGTKYLCGVGFGFALFELLAVPMAALHMHQSTLTIVWTVIMLAAAVWGYVKNGAKSLINSIKTVKLSKLENILLAVIVVLAMYHVAFICINETFVNSDDCFYVSKSVGAVYSNTISEYNYYTGAEAAPFWDGDRSFAPWSNFVATLAQLTGMHAAVVSRTALPAYLIPLSLLVYYCLAKRLFNGNIEKSMWMTIFVACLYVFNATDQHVRTWWTLVVPWYGKNIVTNIMLPMVIFFMLSMEQSECKKDKNRMWLALFISCLGTCMVAATGWVLVPCILLIWGAVYFVRTKDLSALWKLPLCVAPALTLYVSVVMM